MMRPAMAAVPGTAQGDVDPDMHSLYSPGTFKILLAKVGSLLGPCSSSVHHRLVIIPLLDTYTQILTGTLSLKPAWQKIPESLESMDLMEDGVSIQLDSDVMSLGLVSSEPPIGDLSVVMESPSSASTAAVCVLPSLTGLRNSQAPGWSSLPSAGEEPSLRPLRRTARGDKPSLRGGGNTGLVGLLRGQQAVAEWDAALRARTSPHARIHLRFPRNQSCLRRGELVKSPSLAGNRKVAYGARNQIERKCDQARNELKERLMISSEFYREENHVPS
ncbi:hypothetical protein EYF80_005252 [Liparis tanakae]|uniref:Uncharacterized protein n=1 Tax=Liparis tanakae TaxID=230148 RepID=A0A4Z2J4Z5_9TELE|nr:hypothetical protein EYF80_005252 [Liparis tanakae]